MNLRELIKKIILSEAKKLVVKAKPTSSYTIDVRYTTHAEERKKRSGIEDYDTRPIEKEEVVTLMQSNGSVFADHLMTGEIKDGIPFVLKSLQWSLAVSIIPRHEGGLYWKFIVTTVFRESPSNPFRTGFDQLVINV